MLRELDDIAPSQIAARMGITKGGITKLADRLAERGLVVGRGNAGDGRSVALALTDAGRAAFPGLAALADANDAAFFDAFADERGTLRALLVGLAEPHRIEPSPMD